MQLIPLSGRVVFVDWHGVLSTDPFWMSIRESVTHPLRGQLGASLGQVFSADTNMAKDWMTGLLTSDQVIDVMNVRLDRRFGADFLARRLDVDCRRMRVNVDLFEALRQLRSTAMIVLATDNMDCFVRAFVRVRRRGRRPGPNAQTLADWAIVFDDIVCSSQVGALKAEDPVAFFGGFLARHGLTFQDAALVDDRADNCRAFAEQGGTPMPYQMISSDTNELRAKLVEWLSA
jgi:FMN phosphatase YigB (HAD superfamily)